MLPLPLYDASDQSHSSSTSNPGVSDSDWSVKVTGQTPHKLQWRSLHWSVKRDGRSRDRFKVQIRPYDCCFECSSSPKRTHLPLHDTLLEFCPHPKVGHVAFVVPLYANVPGSVTPQLQHSFFSISSSIYIYSSKLNSYLRVTMDSNQTPYPIG